MFRQQHNLLICDFCGANYGSENEIRVHQFFHTDQDFESLESSMSKFDGRFKFPVSRTNLRNGQSSSNRVSEYYKANEDHDKAYENWKKNPKDREPVPRIRPMIDRIDQMISLCSDYPLEKSTNNSGEKCMFSDYIKIGNVKEMVLEYHQNIESKLKKQFLEGSDHNLSRNISETVISTCSSSAKPTNQNLNFDDDSYSKSHNDLNSKSQNADSGKISTSKLPSLKKTELPISKPYFGHISPLLKSVLKNKLTNVAQDTTSTSRPLKEYEHSTPKSTIRSSSDSGPILCSVKLSDLAKSCLEKTINTTPKSVSDINSALPGKSRFGIADMEKHPFSDKPLPKDEVSSHDLASLLKSRKSVLSDEMKLKWKSRFLVKSSLSNSSNTKLSGKSSSSNSVSDTESIPDEKNSGLGL